MSEIQPQEHSKSNFLKRVSKKITGFLFEFLMVFLAVFCGFLADNQRELMTEHETVIRGMTSLTEDLKKDIDEIDK